MNNQQQRQQQQRSVTINPTTTVQYIPKRTEVVGQTIVTNPHGQSQLVPVTEGWVRQALTQSPYDEQKARHEVYLDQFFAKELQDPYTHARDVTTNRGTTPKNELISPWHRKPKNGNQGGRKTKKNGGRKSRKMKGKGKGKRITRRR